MANAKLFKSTSQQNIFKIPAATITNKAGGKAYGLDPKAALAQLVMTGTLSNTFYATAEQQLGDVLELARTLVKTEPMYLAKLALYARDKGYMKDTPALLLAVLASENSSASREALTKAFPKVVDNGKMLRNFAQIIRSGQLGRKSFGSQLKKLMQAWLNARKPENLFKDSIGNTPSLADVIKMVHPRPENEERASLYSYLIGQTFNATPEKGIATAFDKLPSLIKDFEAWKKDNSLPLPEVPFQMLTALPLSEEQWATIAKNASWQTVRMNLNTFARHGVFKNPEMVQLIANKLKNANDIRRSKVFPYQLLTAYQNISSDIPAPIVAALETAMELAVENIPTLEGNVVVCPDVSGSMSSAITGRNGSVSSKTRCIDIAALVASAILKKNPNARVLPFEGNVVPPNRCPIANSNSILQNAQILSRIGGGSTNCAAPLSYLNSNQAQVDYVIYISDNESWVSDPTTNGMVLSWGSRRGTETMIQWEVLKKRCPNAKMVCIDVQPNTTTQAISRTDILNVGGFSDSVFDVVFPFLAGRSGTTLWVDEIEAIQL